MSNDQPWTDPVPEEEGSVLPRRRVEDTAEMDITPLIDITFLLLIFFLVCSTMSRQASVRLPPARHGTAINERSAVIITVDGDGGRSRPAVYLGDGTSGTPLPDEHDVQAAAILAAVEEGFRTGKPNVLVKAAGAVRHGDVERVSTAAAQVEGIKLHLGVLEAQ